MNCIEIPGLGQFNVVAAENISGCVDPRRGHQVGAERGAGASGGKTMALLQVKPDLPVARAIKLVSLAEGEQGRPYTEHGDTHKHWAGCGHIFVASNPANEASYGVSSERVLDMRLTTLEMAEYGMIELDDPVLLDDHRESAVVVVDSDKWTVDPVNDKHEVFRYDRRRVQRSLDSLAEFVSREEAVKGEVLKKVFERHTTATLSFLGLGLPIWLINLDTGEVKSGGKVPTPREHRSQLKIS